MAKDNWQSKIGFVLAAVGSAVGLANIWRFPYIMASNGGGAFLCLYLLFLIVLGLPMISLEVWAGSSSGKGPAGAFYFFSNKSLWKKTGFATIVTGFLISSFYSIVCGWIVYYIYKVLFLWDFSAVSQGFLKAEFSSMIATPLTLLFFNALVLLFCFFILSRGVKKGIELANEWMMPVLLVLLFGVAIKGVSAAGSFEGVAFVFKPSWDVIDSKVVLLALGQAFFTLSLGQGTMITYGSYLGKKVNTFKLCLPVVFVDTLISLLSAVAIFSIAFAHQMPVSAGEGLLFLTLPLAFQQMAIGKILMLVFLLLVLIAAISSEISALEPSINYLVEEKSFKRKSAVALVVLMAFIIGLPVALSLSMPSLSIYGQSLFEFLSFVTTSIMVPIGALAILYIVLKHAKEAFFRDTTGVEKNGKTLLKRYLHLSLMYIAPIMILTVFIAAFFN
ncbi:MAG: sodium-dependent transporter [Chlamydiales bacterium]|nr:sodium-dependent transporter [Chlamydiales bacterium]